MRALALGLVLLATPAWADPCRAPDGTEGRCVSGRAIRHCDALRADVDELRSLHAVARSRLGLALDDAEALSRALEGEAARAKVLEDELRVARAWWRSPWLGLVVGVVVTGAAALAVVVAVE